MQNAIMKVESQNYKFVKISRLKVQFNLFFNQFLGVICFFLVLINRSKILFPFAFFEQNQSKIVK
jgi:hypothetical protein